MARRRRECPFARCRRGLIAHRAALAAQRAQIPQQQQGLHKLPPERRLLPKLTSLESKHLLNYHSAKQVRVITTHRQRAGLSIYLSRRPDRNMAFVCVCDKQFMSRACIRQHYDNFCAQKPIPPGYPGVAFQPARVPTQDGQDAHQEENEDEEEEEEEEEEDEENEEDAQEPAHSYNTRSSNRITHNSAERLFGNEFVQAIETTRCLQKQSLELHQKTIEQLMELHQSAKEHIRELRQELQEERSTRRLALQALMDAQAAHQEERQEWTVERLSLLAHLETEQRERQEDQERISSIESRLKRSIMALGEDTSAYRTPSTSEDSPVFAKPIVFPGY